MAAFPAYVSVYGSIPFRCRSLFALRMIPYGFEVKAAAGVLHARWAQFAGLWQVDAARIGASTSHSRSSWLYLLRTRPSVFLILLVIPRTRFDSHLLSSLLYMAGRLRAPVRGQLHGAFLARNRTKSTISDTRSADTGNLGRVGETTMTSKRCLSSF